jgi:hypothetical protein
MVGEACFTQGHRLEHGVSPDAICCEDCTHVAAQAIRDGVDPADAVESPVGPLEPAQRGRKEKGAGVRRWQAEHHLDRGGAVALGIEQPGLVGFRHRTAFRAFALLSARRFM